MKYIRYFSALLLILAAVLHARPFFKVPQDPDALTMLGFAIVYFSTGIFLFLKLKISSLLGMIFPLIGIGTGIFVMGLNNITPLLGIMLAIDVVVVLCCSILFFNREKENAGRVG